MTHWRENKVFAFANASSRTPQSGDAGSSGSPGRENKVFAFAGASSCAQRAQRVESQDPRVESLLAPTGLIGLDSATPLRFAQNDGEQANASSRTPHSGDPDAEAGQPKANIGAADGPQGERQDGASKSSAFAGRENKVFAFAGASSCAQRAQRVESQDPRVESLLAPTGLIGLDFATPLRFAQNDGEQANASSRTPHRVAAHE